jgi:hypothetical protein
MKVQDGGRVSMCTVRRSTIWTLFAVLLVVLTWSAVVGTQSVQADGFGCDTNTCSWRQRQAVTKCSTHGGLYYFECPSAIEPGDYLFFCNDQYNEVDDCSTGFPS